ncbi:UDP-glucuronic acid decarboxylase family protein [Chondromyces apiculatus]|uniref:dTDP-glucose 4,6-dehydratase n=1 Tax=Chondromyces apiculatus DSM 436 TaxID=1192034 RepID=A0A017T2Y1_9BACT|nr:UDP-glucuronic acid decarboxylase family protein [Chondromyces apiculatus]EYF03205.1 dTDP-glucose 4,6-dehydratase [Chondromyces apiculatus DSM 436]
METRQIIVTGGAGFVGSHLCERLLREGHEVLALDNFATGSPKNVAHLLKDTRFKLEVHDVIWPFTVAASRIYNLACPASPPHYQRDPVQTTLTSVMGVLNGLLLARRQGARFLQASTSEVYGDPEVHPQPEDYRGAVNPVGVRACYDEGKRCAESLTMDFHRVHAVEVRLARIFNTYGPRMAFDDGRVVSNFIIQALRGEDLTIYGDGSQTRSFCYVDDLVDGLVRLMEHPEERGPVNLGNPGEFTVLQLAEEVLSLTGSGSRIVNKPLPEDDPKQRKPVIEHAKRVLGFSPRVPLREGLARTIADFRARLEGTPRKNSAELLVSQ